MKMLAKQIFDNYFVQLCVFVFLVNISFPSFAAEKITFSENIEGSNEVHEVTRKGSIKDKSKKPLTKVKSKKRPSLNKPKKMATKSKLTVSSQLQAEFSRLQAASDVLPVVRFRNGFPRSVKIDLTIDGTTPETQARNFLRNYKSFYLQTDPDNELILKRQSSGVMERVYFSQKYQGIPVFGSELLVGIKNHTVRLTIGELLASDELTRKHFSVIPSISKERAESVARTTLELPSDAATITETKLAIFDLSLIHNVPSNPRLVWRVSLAGNNERLELFVDTHNEKILFTLGLEHQGGGSLHDFDFDLQDAEDEANANDDNCYWGSDDVDVASESWFNSDYSSDPDATFANTHARNTYAFFHNNFNLHSFDNDGEQVEVFIHATVDNASWSPGCELIQFRTGWVDYEVMVHEFTHAIITHNSNLVYAFESGALNESYADIMAVVADRERGDMNWLYAENRTGGSDQFRDMKNPELSFTPQPNRYSQYNTGMPNAGVFPDYGGVHSNSGISNKTAYLMAQGDSFNGVVVQSMGLSKMRDLKYAALRSLPLSAQFEDARDFEVAIADNWANNGNNGFTSQDVCSVRNAWAAVEVGNPDINCDGVEDSSDIDGDFIHISEDNCPFTYNPGQEDFDFDGVGDDCDNCAFASNPDQVDTDNDGKGNVCDADDDGDGCLDEVDDDPLNDSQRIGTYTCIDCSGKAGDLYEGSGKDSDNDGLLNCEDDDDDNDGISDQSDVCPVGKLLGGVSLPNSAGSECKVLKVCDCPVTGIEIIDICMFGGCVELELGLDKFINPDPTSTLNILNPNKLMNKSQMR